MICNYKWRDQFQNILSEYLSSIVKYVRNMYMANEKKKTMTSII